MREGFDFDSDKSYCSDPDVNADIIRLLSGVNELSALIRDKADGYGDADTDRRIYGLISDIREALSYVSGKIAANSPGDNTEMLGLLSVIAGVTDRISEKMEMCRVLESGGFSDRDKRVIRKFIRKYFEKA